MLRPRKHEWWWERDKRVSAWLIEPVVCRHHCIRGLAELCGCLCECPWICCILSSKILLLAKGGCWATVPGPHYLKWLFEGKDGVFQVEVRIWFSFGWQGSLELGLHKEECILFMEVLAKIEIAGCVSSRARVLFCCVKQIFPPVVLMNVDLVCSDVRSVE